VALGEATLDRQALITAVLARSPDVEAARAAWRAALAKVPQATAAEDPMVAYQIAPLSVVGDAPFGQVVRVEQRLPVPGQRALAGDVALAEADAVRGDEADVRLRLALMASNTFDDYYLVERALEINRHHRELMAGIREAAAGQYAAGKTSQQDPIQADSELARIDLERIQLEADRQVVVAQLNGLLHRDLDAALPPSPPRLAIPEVQVQGGDLDAVAVRDRPELRGVEAQARRGEAARRLAVRSRWPVVSVMGEYNGMWDTPEHRWMLGVSISVPLQGAVRAWVPRLKRSRRSIARACCANSSSIRSGSRCRRLVIVSMPPVARSRCTTCAWCRPRRRGSTPP
jgi:cobalt-zinc-cadmium efflux system outer membrane protein